MRAANLGDGRARGELRRHRSENIAAMKGRCGLRWRGQLHGLADGVVEKGEEAVIGADEVMVGCMEGDRAAFSPDPGIHHCDMDRSGRKAAPGAVEEERALEDGKGPHAVGDVDHGCLHKHGKDGPLHGADVRVLEPEVGQQRHDAARLHAAMLSADERAGTKEKSRPTGRLLLQPLRLSSPASTAPARPTSSPECRRRAPRWSAAWRRYWPRSAAPSG